MKTNLIQNFIHGYNNPVSSNKRKEDRNLDIHHELANKTFIRPLEGQGRLVKGNIFNAPITMAKGIVYDVKALSGGLNGDANDHQLGKLNDIGMKLGGLTIAGYLCTKRQTPLTKAMEFVGLGSFFASMAIWPKIAIQYPAQLIHGFNVQQQYEDSFGRKKPFFQDPQFLPWDLYSDDKINKIGDKLGVPKDIPNRREYIQEKMKKIAIQSNTLWMLTAGVATPVMSALICNALEKPLSKPLSAVRNSNNNDMLKNFNKIVESNNYQKINKSVERIISINRNKPLTDKLLKDLAAEIGAGFPYHTIDILVNDMKKMLHTDSRMINSDSIKAISEESAKALQKIGIDDNVVNALIPKPEVMEQIFEEKGYFGNDYPTVEIEKIFTEYARELHGTIDKYNETHPDKKIPYEDELRIFRTLIGDNDSPVIKGLTKEYSAVLNPKNEGIIKGIASAMNDLNGDLKVVNTYILHQLGQAPETVGANYWNETVDKLVKGLKITQKEINETRGDRLLVTKMLQKHYDDVAADKKAYSALVSTLVNQMSKLLTLVKQSDVNEDVLNSKGTNTKLNKIIDTVFAKFEANMEKINGYKKGDMAHFISDMSGKGSTLEAGSYRGLYKKTASDRLLDLKTSFFRILNTLDLHRRIASGNSYYYSVLKGDQPEKSNIYMPRELKEDIVDVSKLIGISGHTSDYLTKYFKLRNADTVEEDFSDIEVKNGRMVRKYAVPTEVSGAIDKPQAKDLFVGSMRLQYEMPLYSDTVSAFGPKQKELFEEFKKYRSFCLEQIGNANAVERNVHKVSGAASTASNALIFRITGAATDEVISNYGKQSFNTNKWLKIFGTTGAVLLGLTVAAQFFFGKMKLPQNHQAQDTTKG